MTVADSEQLQGSPPKILIVEDEGIIAGHIATRLERTGYSIAGIVASSEEALAKIPELTPDLILMDIHIRGGADGIETAQSVREQFDIPVIYLTAHSDQQTIDRAKKTGAFGFLTKPIHHASLATSVEMALYKHASDRDVRRQRAWLETVLETMADAVVVIDLDGKMQFMNHPGESLTGWTNGDARDRHISAILPLSEPAKGWSGNAPARFPEGTMARTRSGQLFVVDGEIASSLDEGKLVGRVITFRDATERHHEERKRRHDSKMQAVGRLAAGIAHDFNNLLFVILGFTDELRQNLVTTGKATPDALTHIKNAAETAAGITRQLLQFSRPEPSEHGDLSLNEIIRETEVLWKQLAGRGIQWETRLDPRVATVWADSGELKQVLMNLIANARDSMPNGGVLTIETANVEHDGSSKKDGSETRVVALTVRDTGTGMSQEVADRLFEPYFTTKAKGKGTGLGLAIVHRIVSDLGGTIHVVSEPGKGSAFSVYLPMKKAAALAVS